MKARFLLLLLFLSCLNLHMTAQNFGVIDIIKREYEELSDIVAADIDGDGDLDAVTSARYGFEAAFHENMDGKGYFARPQVLSTFLNGALDVLVVDLDIDGDLDIVSATFFTANGTIFWFENLDGFGHFREGREITSLPIGTQSIDAADFDGDGDMDLLSLSGGDDVLAWYEHVDGHGGFGPQHFIFQQNFHELTLAKSADMDGDGDADIVMLEYAFIGNELVWMKNLDGAGNFSAPISLAGNGSSNSQDFHLLDFDGDGDMDIVRSWATSTTNNGNIGWIENLDGLGNFSDNQEIYFDYEHDVNSIVCEDFDNDGDLDLMSMSRHFMKLHTNDGSLNFTTTDAYQFSNTPQKGGKITAGDVDKDGNLDVLAIFHEGDYERFVWLKNADGQGHLTDEKSIPAVSVDFVSSLFAADLDGDGDSDLLSASEYDNKIAWYENKNGFGDFSTQEIVAGQVERPKGVSAGDMDGDGDLDVVYVSLTDSIMAWTENMNGNGLFETKHIITSEAYFPKSLKVADLNNNGLFDVISRGSSSDQLVWYENENGDDFTKHFFNTSSTNFDFYFDTGDLDGDGDLDVVVGYDESDVVWFENTDGLGNFGDEQVVTTDFNLVSSVRLSDLDGDNDLDLLLVSNIENKLAWLENTDGLGSLESLSIISSDIGLTGEVTTADVDLDGDVDIVACGEINNSYQVVWFENLDGKANFGSPQKVVNFDNAVNIMVADDFDGDGDTDVAFSSSSQDMIAYAVNFTKNNFVIGRCFFDRDQNGSFGPNDQPLPNHSVNIDIGGVTSYSNEMGNYYFPTTSGVYHISSEPPPGWYLTTDSSSYTFEFHENDPPINFQSLKFGFAPITTAPEVQPNITTGIPRCNSKIPMWVDCKNYGVTPESGFLAFHFDSLTSFVAASPPPDSIVGGIYYWGFEDLPPQTSFKVYIENQMPDESNIGKVLVFQAEVTLMDDTGEVIGFYSDYHTAEVRCAFDPNDKLVEPNREAFMNLTLFEEDLIYTVRFQNTGNDTAYNVQIRDNLSSRLDLNTLEPIAASHDYYYYVSSGTVNFIFDNINLPDSTTNWTGSQGFVKFKISPKENLAEYAQVLNKADIFFDFNPPITTNTVENIFVSQFPVPEAAFTWTSVGLEVAFIDESLNAPDSWKWDFGDGATSTDQHPIHSFSSIGNYTVCLVVENIFGADTVCQPVEILLLPIADFTISINGLEASFVDQTTENPTSWQWDFGDGETSTDQNPTHVYPTSGIYTVCLIATNDQGMDTLCQEVEIKLPPVAGFIFSINLLEISFTDQSTENPTSWFWDFGDGTTSTMQHPIHIFDETGGYNICLTVSNNEGSDFTCKLIFLFLAPEAGFSFTTEDLTATFMDASINGPNTWNWDFGDGTGSMEQNPVHSYLSPGEYQTCLTVANFVSQDTYCDTVMVMANDISEVHWQNRLTLMPNPASDYLDLSFEKMPLPGTSINIRNSIGQLTELTINLMALNNRIEIQHLAAGIYLLEVHEKERFVAGMKFLVLR